MIIDLRRDSNLREAAAVRDGQHHKVLAQKPVEIKPCQSFGKEKAALSSYPCGKVPLVCKTRLLHEMPGPLHFKMFKRDRKRICAQ